MKLKQLGANMTEVTLNDKSIVLFSYETPVAELRQEGNIVSLRVTEKRWSPTTIRHINKYKAYRAPSFLTIMPQEYFDNLVK